jgi:REP-associated tyrosine transposase
MYSRRKKVEKLKYMHENPVKRGQVKHPGEWPWSSLPFYQGKAAALVRIDVE